MKRTIKRALGLAATALLISGATSAQSSNLDKAARILEQQARAGRGEFITYLVGAAAAYRWANEDSETQPLYCMSPDAKLDGKAWARIALEEFKRDKPQYADLQEYPLSVFALALLHGLESKYPCPSKDAEAPAAAGQ